jgi:hypothetical protein
MHFGLGQADKVRVRVLWPHDAANATASAWQTVGADAFYTFDKTRGVVAWRQP